MKKIIIGTVVFVGLVFVLVIGFGVYKFNFTNDDIYFEGDISSQAENATYQINDRAITLKDGVSEVVTGSGSTSKTITTYFGNEIMSDFNGDGKNDIALLLTQSNGGSGTFFYVVALLGGNTKNIGTNAILIGDRIAPMNTEFKDSMIIINYADRNPGEPFTTKPSLGVSRYLKIIDNSLIEVKTDVIEPVISYNNSDYKFGFSYSKNDTLNSNVGYQYVTNNSIARVDLPLNDFTGTNLGEASVIFGASRDQKVIDICLNPAPGENATSTTVIINKTAMTVFTGKDAAAGNIYETKSYRAVKNSICYEVTLLLHSGNIANYPEGTIKEFDYQKALSGLEKILGTLKID